MDIDRKVKIKALFQNNSMREKHVIVVVELLN